MESRLLIALSNAQFIPLSIKEHYAKWSFKALHAMGIRTVQHRLACGQSMLLDTNDVLGQRIRSEDSFEPAVRSEFQRVASSGQNILDLGANIGYYSLLGASLVGQQGHVFSFEPQIHIAAKLRRNIARNALRNVTIFPFALSERAGVAEFYVPVEGMEAHGSLHDNGRFQVEKRVSVETKRLDDVIAEAGIGDVGLVKMDVEGAELPILRGATTLLSTSRPVLIFEANETNTAPFDYGVFDLLQYIQGFGYRLRQIDYEDWLAEPLAAKPLKAAKTLAST
jgi:FkbM family methyltransferase